MSSEIEFLKNQHGAGLMKSRRTDKPLRKEKNNA